MMKVALILSILAVSSMLVDVSLGSSSSSSSGRSSSLRSEAIPRVSWSSIELAEGETIASYIKSRYPSSPVIITPASPASPASPGGLAFSGLSALPRFLQDWKAFRAPWTPSYFVSHPEARSAQVNIKQSKKTAKFGMGCCVLKPIALTTIAKHLEQEASEIEAGDILEEHTDPKKSASASGNQDKSSKNKGKNKGKNKKSKFMYYSGPLDVLGPVLSKDVPLKQETASGKRLDMFDVKEVDQNTLEVDDPTTKITVWLGSKGVITPCHQDAMHNFFVQIYGRKQFTLFPPDAWDALYLYPKYHLQHRNVQVDIDKPNLALFPRFERYLNRSKSSNQGNNNNNNNDNNNDDEAASNAAKNDDGDSNRALIGEVGPGDMLYLPPLWFHQVQAMTPAISVNVWSSSGVIEEINKAWLEEPPIHRLLAPQQQIAFSSIFLNNLIFRVQDGLDLANEFITSLVETRYNLFDISRYHGIEASSNKKPTSDDIFIKSINVDVHPKSPEVMKHREYLDFLKKHSPPIPSELVLMKESCTLQFINAAVNEDEYINIRKSVDNIAPYFEGVPRGIRESYLAHYVEDYIAQVVGEANIPKFVNACLFQIEKEMEIEGGPEAKQQQGKTKKGKKGKKNKKKKKN